MPLEVLDVAACQLSDIRPLEKLTRLESLRLHVNSIRDISFLANLKRLRELWLQYNEIVDITPLAGLTALQELRIAGNPITDWTPLDQLNIEKLTFDEICQFPKLSIRERLENRSFPSTFQAWQPTFSFPELLLETRPRDKGANRTRWSLFRGRARACCTDQSESEHDFS